LKTQFSAKRISPADIAAARTVQQPFYTAEKLRTNRSKTGVVSPQIQILTNAPLKPTQIAALFIMVSAHPSNA
jgi:hypothetical protein